MDAAGGAYFRPAPKRKLTPMPNHDCFGAPEVSQCIQHVDPHRALLDEDGAPGSVPGIEDTPGAVVAGEAGPAREPVEEG
jgi:hypothetical protein